MKNILIILAIAGLSCGLQAPLHYKYKYFASVSTGIPELSSQAAGWAMKADVEVYVEKNDGTAIFQLNDVKTVEFNDKLGCDSRGDIADELFTYIEDEDLSKAIEAPFRVHLFSSEDLSLAYDKDKFRWLVNFKKGIVSIFRNEVLRGNMDDQLENTIASKFQDGNTVNVFTVDEDTLFGRCKAQYSLHRVPDHLTVLKDYQLKDQMEIDVQREIYDKSASYKSKPSKTTKKYSSESENPEESAKYSRSDVPKMKGGILRVFRTINFDQCDEIVGFQIKSVGYGEVTGGQVDWRRGRSSTSEFLFRGSSGYARLEKAVVEGATTFAPFGFKSELLQARTNQTLQLVSVTIGGAIPIVSDDVQYSKTWMEEVWSFAEPPKYSEPRPWVVYTGEGDVIGRFQTYGVDYLSLQQAADIKDKIIRNIKIVSLILTDLEQKEEARTESPSKLLQDTSYLFKFVSKETALEIFGIFFEKDLHQSDVLAR